MQLIKKYIQTRTYILLFRTAIRSLRIPFTKLITVAPALSVIWDTVNYQCVKYSHRCVSIGTVQSGIYTINVYIQLWNY
jgi:hypothetical protein